MREQVRCALIRVGWLDGAGGLRPTRPGFRFVGESFAAVYPAVQGLEEFHRLAHTDRLRSLMAAILGAEVFCQPSKVVRLVAPSGDRWTTRAHQDFVTQHVSSDVLTVWAPLTPCSPQRQGLRVIPGSHRDGFLRTDSAIPGTRALYLPIADDDPRWVTTNYSPGDVVVFHSLTVHCAGPNTSEELRLSIDVRFQRTDDPMLEPLAQPHGWPRTPGWDYLSEGWRSRRWIELPERVRLVPIRADVPYAELLDALVAPPSRLLDRP